MLWQALILSPLWFQDRRALVCLMSVKADKISAALGWKDRLYFRIWDFSLKAWKFLKHWHDFRKALPVAVFVVKRAHCASIQWPLGLQGSLTVTYLGFQSEPTPGAPFGQQEMQIVCRGSAGNRTYCTRVLRNGTYVTLNKPIIRLYYLQYSHTVS